MRVVHNTDELKEARARLDGSVGFVPTMGALHDGHISLIKNAKEDNDNVIVSIFVNPTQFLEGEDLDSYPSKIEADTKICELAGVDILFLPTKNDMYEENEISIGAPAIQGYILEGEKRPGHFDGMLQIVLKLLILSAPTRAYFGKKDAQQLSLITQMVRSYFLNVEVIPCDIIRDKNGLALSSRNKYLDAEGTTRALCLSKSLTKATHQIISGERKSSVIKKEMLNILQEADSVDYVAIVDRDFNDLENIEIENSIILVAAWIGTTRLIDNIWV